MNTASCGNIEHLNYTLSLHIVSLIEEYLLRKLTSKQEIFAIQKITVDPLEQWLSSLKSETLLKQ